MTQEPSHAARVVPDRFISVVKIVRAITGSERPQFNVGGKLNLGMADGLKTFNEAARQLQAIGLAIELEDFEGSKKTLNLVDPKQPGFAEKLAAAYLPILAAANGDETLPTLAELTQAIDCDLAKQTSRERT
jgi:hypothetical protein